MNNSTPEKHENLFKEHERIYLQPPCCSGYGVYDREWCEDPSAFECESGLPPVEFIRADLVATLKSGDNRPQVKTALLKEEERTYTLCIGGSCYVLDKDKIPFSVLKKVATAVCQELSIELVTEEAGGLLSSDRVRIAEFCGSTVIFVNDKKTLQLIRPPGEGEEREGVRWLLQALSTSFGFILE